MAGIPAGEGEAVILSLDGTSCEIDLPTTNASVLRRALRPYIGAGRAIKGSRRRQVRTTDRGRYSHRQTVSSCQLLPGARPR
jgi:hypothetical protein